MSVRSKTFISLAIASLLQRISPNFRDDKRIGKTTIFIQGQICFDNDSLKFNFFQPIIRADVPEITFHLYPNVIVPSTFLRVVAAKSLADPL